MVSGATAGIGWMTAKLLLLEGAEVMINGRSQQKVIQAVNRLKQAVPQAKVSGCAADLSNPAAIVQLCASIGSLDILVNNVGIYHAKSFSETSDEDWREQLELNLMSGVRLSRYFLPKMLAQNWGRILFISSECAILVPKDLIAYGVTKAAILALSRGLAQTTKGSAVTVNALLPGSTHTAGAHRFLTERAAQTRTRVKQVEANFFTQERPTSLIQRFATEEEVAQTITYYASPLSAATNGAAIRIDGGSTAGII